MRDRGIRRVAPSGVAGAIAIIAATAASAQAMTLPPDWVLHGAPGRYGLTVEPGTTAIEVVALGGRGGGVNGGSGAVAHGTIPVTTGQIVTFHVAAPPPVSGVLPGGNQPAGSGGNASYVTVCAPAPARCIPLLSPRVLVAAGGGGAGAGTPLLSGGAGGAAGSPGADGATGAQTVAAGRGGGAGTGTAGGAGGAAGVIPDDCVVGISNGPGNRGSIIGGGAGGAASDESRRGGAGGDGYYGGGGGGSAATCNGEQAGGAGGGGGGASLVPAGGNVTVNTDPSATHVRYRLVKESTAPTVTIAAPLDGGSYDQDADVQADYTCTDEAGGSGLESCRGSVADGEPIDTASVGAKTFTVTARDKAGNVTTQSVAYVVRAVAPKPPTVRGLAVTKSVIRFTLSKPARVTLRLERRKPGRRARYARVRTLRYDGARGVNRVALKRLGGRRRLAPGTYRLAVETSVQGRPSTLARRTFSVRARRARARR